MQGSRSMRFVALTVWLCGLWITPVPAQTDTGWRLSVAQTGAPSSALIPDAARFEEHDLTATLDASSGLWLRLEPQRQACRGVKDAVLTFRNAYFQRMTLHWRTRDGWQSEELGTVPGVERPFSGRRPAAHLDNYACGDPLFAALTHPVGLTLRPNLQSYDAFLASEFSYLRWISLFFAALGALALYNLFVAWRLGEKVFVFYSAYLASVLGFFYFQEGLAFREYSLLTVVGNRVTSIFSALCVYFTLLFVERFMRADLIAPRLSRFALKWPRPPLLAALILIAVLPDSQRWIGGTIVGYLSLYCTPMVLLTAALCWRHGSVAGAYVTVAWSAVLVAVAYRVLALMGVFELNTFALYGVQAGATVEALVLAFGLAHVVSNARLERDAAQQRLIKEQSLRMHQEFLADFRASLDEARRVDQVWSQTARAFRRLFRARALAIWESTGDFWQPSYSSDENPPIAPDLQAQLRAQEDLGKLVATHHESPVYVAWLQLSDTHALFFQLVVEAGHRPLDREAEYFADYARPLMQSLETLQYIDSIRERMQRDSLTGAYNRDYARQALIDLLGEEADVSVLYCDLDRFKQINDEHGHSTGDEILVRFVETVNDCLADSEWLARLGGEEFLCVTQSNEDSAYQLANRIRAALEAAPITIAEEKFRLTISVGVATARSTETVDSLLERADRAMYEAKNAGRNRVIIARA